MTSKLSKKQAARVELQEAFNLFDDDGNGEVKIIPHLLIISLQRRIFNWSYQIRNDFHLQYLQFQITLAELKNLVIKLQTDPKHNFKGGKDDMSPLMHAEIEALLKFADKDKSGTITFDVWKYNFV